jgi:hypothetical protein
MRRPIPASWRGWSPIAAGRPFGIERRLVQQRPQQVHAAAQMGTIPILQKIVNRCLWSCQETVNVFRKKQDCFSHLCRDMM